MKNVKVFIILMIVAAVLGLGSYCARAYIKTTSEKKELEIQEYNKIFIQKALDEFNRSSSIKSSKVAQKLVDELNQKTKNPYNAKKPAYTFEKTCSSCTSVEYDDVARIIVITSYNKKGDLTQRTIINPPSFVTYTK